MGGKVPLSYYLGSDGKILIPKEDMEMINIRPGAGGRKKIKINVEVIDTTIRLKLTDN